MNKVFGMTVVALALAGLSGNAFADGKGRGQERAHKHLEKAMKHERKAAEEYRKAEHAQRGVRYHDVDGRRYPVVVRDGRDYYQRDGRFHPLPGTDDRDRRYHERSGKWDNGRRGAPSWAKGKDYRSYGYPNVVNVPVGDYSRYGLYAPRDGYRWVRDDAGHYMLVSLANGVIADILNRRF